MGNPNKKSQRVGGVEPTLYGWYKILKLFHPQPPNKKNWCIYHRGQETQARNSQTKLVGIDQKLLVCLENQENQENQEKYFFARKRLLGFVKRFHY